MFYQSRYQCLSAGTLTSTTGQVARQPSPFERAHSNESYHWQRAGAFGDAAGNSQHDRFKRPSFSSLPVCGVDYVVSSLACMSQRTVPESFQSTLMFLALNIAEDGHGLVGIEHCVADS